MATETTGRDGQHEDLRLRVCELAARGHLSEELMREILDEARGIVRVAHNALVIFESGTSISVGPSDGQGPDQLVVTINTEEVAAALHTGRNGDGEPLMSISLNDSDLYDNEGGGDRSPAGLDKKALDAIADALRRLPTTARTVGEPLGDTLETIVEWVEATDRKVSADG